MEAPLQERPAPVSSTRVSSTRVSSTRTTRADYFSTVIIPVYDSLLRGYQEVLDIHGKGTTYKYIPQAYIVEALDVIAMNHEIQKLAPTDSQRIIEFTRGEGLNEVLTDELIMNISQLLTKCKLPENILIGKDDVSFTIAEGKLLSPVDILLLGFINEIVTFSKKKYKSATNETFQKFFKKRLDCIALCFGMTYSILSGRGFEYKGYEPVEGEIIFTTEDANKFIFWHEILRERNNARYVYDFQASLNNTLKLIRVDLQKKVKTVGSQLQRTLSGISVSTISAYLDIHLYINPYKSETIRRKLKEMTIPTYIAVLFDTQTDSIKEVCLLTFEQLKEFQRNNRGNMGNNIHYSAMGEGPTVIAQFNAFIQFLSNRMGRDKLYIWNSLKLYGITKLKEQEKELVELIVSLYMAKNHTQWAQVQTALNQGGFGELMADDVRSTFIAEQDERINSRATGEVGGYRKRKNKRKSSRRKTTRRKTRKKTRKKKRKKTIRRKSR